MQKTYRIKNNHFLSKMNALKGPYEQKKEAIIDQCGVSPATFYRWLSGSSEPSKLEKQVIAKILKLKVSQLWPTEN